ncbi:MAG: ABC transporter permease [Chloroflexota bacterium]|nr:ABC transporter permease [Chloroflexota bacterium]
MILKNLWGRKIRTLLTLLGIAIGVAAVVALGALAQGFIDGYGALSGGSGADLLVAQDDAVDIVFSAVDDEIGPVLADFAGVTEVTPMVYTFAATNDVPYFILYGYDPDSFAIQHFKIVEGEPLSNRLSRRGGKPLLLGWAAADDLHKHVGDAFRLYDSTYRIVGIYETGQAFEDGAAVTLLKDAQTIGGKPRQVNAFLLKVRPGTDMDQLSQRIEQRFADLTVTTSSDFSQQQEMLKYIRVFTWAVSLIAVLIGGVGVMNTMLMSVSERTREFGVLRAVGWRPARVLRMVLGESLILCLWGGLVGSALGVMAVWGVQHLPLGDMLVSKAFSPLLFAQGMGVALMLGLVGGALPAWHAAKLLPAEAMRAEGGAARTRRRMGRLLHGVKRILLRSSMLRNVMRQPTRTLLTISGIAIAMIAIITLGALGDGLVKQVTGMTGGLGTQLVGMEADASIDLSTIDEGVVRRLTTLPGVRAAEGFLTGYTTVGDLPFFVVFGYRPRGLAIRDFRIIEGQALASKRQIILGRVAAENLNKKVGQNLHLFDSTYKIVGIYETGVPMQDGGGVISLRDAQNLFGQPHKVSFLGIWLDDPRQAAAVAQEIEAHFPEVSISQASDFTEDIVDLRMMRNSTWAIALMALIVGGLGMTNTMVMSVFERTREIGVLRALGWRRRRVLRMILHEAITLSLLGGVLGIGLGVLMTLSLNATPWLQGFIKMQFSVGLFVKASLTALVLGAVGGLYPAWRASNLLPVEALRYE